jgi:electron transport complex protein RnfA
LTFQELGETGTQQGANPLLRTAVLFFSGLLPWMLMSFVIAPLGLGAAESLLLYPITVLICLSANKIFRRSEKSSAGFPSVWNSYDGLALFSAFITLRLATYISEALAVAAGLALGHLAATAVLRHIGSRSSIEAVPAFLRGTPLLMISAGLVSLVASFTAAILLRALNGM